MTPRRKTGSSPRRKAATRSAASRKVAKSTALARKPVSKTAGVRPAASKAPAKRAARRSATLVSNIARDCTIAHAGNLRASLARLAGKPASVTLDLASIRRIDTAGMQVLAAFIRERRAAGYAVQCEGATDEFLHTVKLLGLGALFSPVMDDGLGVPAGNA